MNDRHGLGDPRIPWLVLLETGMPAARPTRAELTARLGALAQDAGWPAPGAGAVIDGDRRGLLDQLAGATSEPLRIGVHPDGVVLGARHDCLDGLGLLTAAETLLGTRVRSSARGIGADRSGASTAGMLVRRGWEVLARPPARVAAPPRPGAVGDSFAARTVQGAPRTADLVLAGAGAIVAWNREHQRAARRVSVAIGVSTVGAEDRGLADRSGFLRLTGVETLDAEAVRRAIAEAPAQPNSVPGAASALSGTLLRMVAGRLGSTLLVSHLGEVTVDDADLEPLSFYPVTGGGSGLSLGAATVAGRTTLTLRSRAARHGDPDLSHLLDLVVAALQAPAS